MLFLHRSQNGPGQRVIAAKRQGNRPIRQNAVVILGDDIHGLFQIEGVNRHIANIGHLQMLKGGRPGRHVIGPQHPALVPDLARTHPRARPVRGAMVHRNADEGHIQPLGPHLRGQAHHGRRAAKAGHVIATQGLIERAHSAASCRAKIPIVPAKSWAATKAPCPSMSRSGMNSTMSKATIRALAATPAISSNTCQ